VLNSATRFRQSRADEVDNQIDVASKALSRADGGLRAAAMTTIRSCADNPITTPWLAFLHSTDIHEAVIDSPSRAREIAAAGGIQAFSSPPASGPQTRRHCVRRFHELESDGQAFGDFPVQGAATLSLLGRRNSSAA